MTLPLLHNGGQNSLLNKLFSDYFSRFTIGVSEKPIKIKALLNSSMNDDFFSLTQRRKGAKFCCLFL
jgi:hypothetical protein